MIEPVTVCDEALAKDLEEIELTIFGTIKPKTYMQIMDLNRYQKEKITIKMKMLIFT